MERRDLLLQLLKDDGGPVSESDLLERMRALHGIHLTPQSVRMLLRGLAGRVSYVVKGGLGLGHWEFSADGRAR
jgi:hypothetical protein